MYAFFGLRNGPVYGIVIIYIYIYIYTVYINIYSDESRTRRDEQRRKYSKMDKRQRLGWLGHLERMEENRIPKKIFTQELEGTRRRGRPRERWKQEVERDLHISH